MNQILFAEDDAAMRQMVAELLGAAGFQVRLANDGVAALEAVHQALPDLVILDYRMGNPDGFQVCRTLKSDPRYAHVPVLILTGQGEVDYRIEGFDAGADDYLGKPFDPRELVARVRALTRLAREGLDRNPTTGMPGGEAVQREFQQRCASAEPFCICYFDLDHFKPFNDRFGFAVADRVIREAGAAIAGAAAACDAFAGHVGGDDFVCIVPPHLARSLIADAQARFHSSLQQHLPPEVFASGRYSGVDREGVEREFSITRLAAALVHADPRRIGSLAELSETVAAAKHQAKHEPSGISETTYPPPPDRQQADRAGGALSSRGAA